MSCFENISMPNCVWFEGGERRNVLSAMAAGFLVSTYYNFLDESYFCSSGVEMIYSI